MLALLRGKEHRVYTALALHNPGDGTTHRELCASTVRMRAYSDEEIEAYAASGDPLDKAGGYAIQDPTFHPVEGFAGCYASVMGCRSATWSAPCEPCEWRATPPGWMSRQPARLN